MAKDVSTLDDFQFDGDDDFGFGGSSGSTNISAGAVAANIKEDDDDDGVTSVDDAKPDAPKEVVIEKAPVKKEAPKREAPVKKEKVATKKVEEDDDADVDEDEDEDEEEEVEEEFFEDPKETKKEKGDKVDKKPKEPVEETQDEDTFYNTLFEELQAKGVFEHAKLPKNKVITEDEFLDLHVEEVEARVQEVIEAWAEQLDDDGKAYLRHKQKGGSTLDFIQAYGGVGIDFDKVDLKKDTDRLRVIKASIATIEGLEGEELQDRLDYLKDTGKEDAYAEKALAKLKKADADRKATLDKQLADAEKAQAEADREFDNSIKTLVASVDNINGVPISKAEQKELPAYMNKPTVKVGKNKYVPALQAELGKIMTGKTEKDRKNLILLAKFVKNNFDLSDLVPVVETKVTRRANNILQRAKQSSVKAATSGGYSRTSLADHFG